MTTINTTSEAYKKAYNDYLGGVINPDMRFRNLANKWARKQTNQ